MRPIISLPLAAAFALTACGDSAGDQPKTMEEVADAAASIERPEPGKYRSTSKLLELDMPGLPPAQAAQMKEMMSGATSQSHEFCLTEAEIEKGYEELVQKSTDGNCTFEKFDTTSNTLDARMTCNMEEGVVSNVALTGEMNATRSRMLMDMNSSAPQMPGGKMNMKMEVINERIGDCD